MKKLLISFIFVLNSFASEVYATFDVEALKESKLTLSSVGIVEKLYVDIGDRVKKGELLVELENSEEVADLEVAKSEVTLAKTSYEHSSNTYSRYEKIKDVIDEEQMERYEFDKSLKAKELAKAEKKSKLKEVVVNKTKLFAPYSGVITKKFIEVGDGVGGATTKLLTLVDDSKVKLILSFDEKYWKQVKKGQKFKYKVDGTNEFKEGIITKVYPIVEKDSRKLKAEVIASGVLVGLFGDGTIEVE